MQAEIHNVRSHPMYANVQRYLAAWRRGEVSSIDQGGGRGDALAGLAGKRRKIFAFAMSAIGTGEDTILTGGPGSGGIPRPHPIVPGAPAVESASSITSTLTIQFNIPMDTSTGLAGGGWSWRNANQMYSSTSASWLDSRTLQIVTFIVPDADAGANVFSYNAAAGDVRAATSGLLAAIVNQPWP